MSDYEKYLDMKFIHTDISTKPITFRKFFQELLLTLWSELEGFSGKRPFGNSCWDNEVYAGLVKNGLVKGHIDEDGGVEELDYQKADDIIFKMIKEL